MSWFSRKKSPRRERIKRRSQLSFDSLETREMPDWTLMFWGNPPAGNVYASMEQLLGVTVWGAPPGVYITSVAWQLPAEPVAFAWYEHVNSGSTCRGELHELTPPAFANNVSFHWGPVDQSVTVSVTVTLSDQTSKSASLTFNVDEPSLTSSGKQEHDPFADDLDANPMDPDDPLDIVMSGGIEYTLGAHADRPGEFFFIQLVKHTATATMIDGTTLHNYPPGQPPDFGLDDGSDEAAHYTLPQSSWTTDGSGNVAPQLIDFPAIGLHIALETGGTEPFREVDWTFDAESWLMYRAFEFGNAVPVAHAQWQVSGHANLRQNATGQYLDGLDLQDWQVGGTTVGSDFTASNDWPEWNQRAPASTVWY